MNKCSECLNEFVQPFVCTTCGAEKLYDATVREQAMQIESLRALLFECRDWVDNGRAQAAAGIERYESGDRRAIRAARELTMCDGLLLRIDAALGEAREAE